MKSKFFIIFLIFSVSTKSFAQEKFNLVCQHPKLNLSKMQRAMEKLKRDQKFIFPEKLNSFIATKEEVPEKLNNIFSAIQLEAFGKNLLTLRTVRSSNFSGDPFHKSVDYDPRLLESLTTQNGYTDPESLLNFILAHEVSHFIQDFIASNKESMNTVNGMVLISDTAQHTFGGEKLYSLLAAEAKKSGMSDPSSDDMDFFIGQRYHLAHLEVDAYTYILLKKLNYKLPNIEDFRKLILRVSGGNIESSDEFFQVERCGYEQRRNLLIKLSQELFRNAS